MSQKTTVSRFYLVRMQLVFGIEIFIHNIVAMYYVDHFHFGLKEAGMAAGIFGLLALFARALGGIVSDKLRLKRA